MEAGAAGATVRGEELLWSRFATGGRRWADLWCRQVRAVDGSAERGAVENDAGSVGAAMWGLPLEGRSAVCRRRQ